MCISLNWLNRSGNKVSNYYATQPSVNSSIRVVSLTTGRHGEHGYKHTLLIITATLLKRCPVSHKNISAQLHRKTTHTKSMD